MDQDKIIQQVLEKIVPKGNEVNKIRVAAKKALDAANLVMKKFDPDVKVLVEGSVAKNTWIAGSCDIDVFILFPLFYKDKDLEKIALPLLKKIGSSLGKIELKYAQHPYVKTEVDRIGVEFVPGFQSKPPNIISAVDRTPYHTEYISKNLQDKNQAILMKQFCKGVKVYGAEQSSLGFSGYLCELLIVKYGSFVDALETISKWKPEGLIIPDPTDPNRNVAAAVSKEKLQLLIRAAKSFLNSPSLKFFFPNPAPIIPPKKLAEELEGRFVQLILFDRPEADVEILFSQVRSFAKHMEKFLDDEGFGCINMWYEVGEKKIAVLFEVEDAQLPVRELKLGPPKEMEAHAEKFWEKCSSEGIQPWIVGERWQAYVPRRFAHLSDALSVWMRGLHGPELILGIMPGMKYFNAPSLEEQYPNLEKPIRQFISVSLLDIPPWDW